MTYKAGDLVYFHSPLQKGVGKIVSKHDCFTDYYLVQSTQIDNGNDWFVNERNLKPFTKKVGQKYKVLHDYYDKFEIGDIVTLYHIDDDCVSYYKKDSVEDYMFDIDHENCELEFYADVEGVKEHKENEMFTKEDLKAGYLVKLRSGMLAHVVNTQEKGLCLNFEEGWDTLEYYDSDLANNSANFIIDIVEVYGYTMGGYGAHKFEVGNRELLWKREEVKEMTIEDIQKVLGHKIKVVE